MPLRRRALAQVLAILGLLLSIASSGFAQATIYTVLVSGDPTVPGSQLVIDVRLKDCPKTIVNYFVDFEYDSNSSTINSITAVSGGFPVTPSVLPLLSSPPTNPGTGAYRQVDAIRFSPDPSTFSNGTLFRVTLTLGETPAYPLRFAAVANHNGNAALLADDLSGSIPATFDSSATAVLPVPTPTPSPSPSPTASPSPTVSPSPTETPTPTPSLSPSPSLTPSPSPTPHPQGDIRDAILGFIPVTGESFDRNADGAVDAADLLVP